MNPIIGIDLGTTNSVVAHTDANGVTTTIAGTDGGRIVPSVVYIEPGTAPVVGERARRYAVVEPERVAQFFKRGMGEKVFLPTGSPFEVDGKTWSPEELSSLVLRKLKQMAEQHFGQEVRQAVITVPAYFGEPERAATRDAGELAELEVVRIVNEPTAAALVHGVDEAAAAGKVLVFDLGGGTFDVTVMAVGHDRSMEVVATGGDRQLGGTDFDHRILERMVEAASAAGADLKGDPWAMSEALATAESLKKELSDVQRATCRFNASGRPVQFILTRDEFESLIADKLQEVEDTVVYTIEERAGLKAQDIGSVLLVGGSSRIPAFQRLLTRICGREPTFSRNLDEDVARGAAILAAKLGGELDARSQLADLPTPVDAASHGFGVTLQVDDAGALGNEVLIPEGSSIPASITRVFGAVVDGQTHVEVVLNEGQDSDLEFVRELGRASGPLGRPVPRGYPIRVEMHYTAEQLITVKAFDGQSGGHICDLEHRYEGRLSEQEMAAARNYLANLQVG
jgi:molecular chaperone DnaK